MTETSPRSDGARAGRYLPLRQAAPYLGRPAHQLRRAIHRGELTAFRVVERPQGMTFEVWVDDDVTARVVTALNGVGDVTPGDVTAIDRACDVTPGDVTVADLAARASAPALVLAREVGAAIERVAAESRATAERAVRAESERDQLRAERDQLRAALETLRTARRARPWWRAW